MSETIFAIISGAFFAIGTLFTIVFIVMMCIDEFSKEKR